MVVQPDGYQAYTQSSIVGVNPINLVVSLYQGAIDSLGQIRECFNAEDIPGRTKGVNKVISILTELLVSLDHERGGDVSANLKRLYSYMQCRILEAHSKKDSEPVEEVEGLLKTLLESWSALAQQNAASGALVASSANSLALMDGPEAPFVTDGFPYGGYFSELSESVLGEALSF
jgi:flagellar protein FliS